MGHKYGHLVFKPRPKGEAYKCQCSHTAKGNEMEIKYAPNKQGVINVKYFMIYRTLQVINKHVLIVRNLR
jgi:hypothetical protein